MTGGIVQLVAYGKEDLFLTRDPQITFFKIIYRRHTNFSREEISQTFVTDPDFGKRTSCLVSAEGDLITHLTLRITLPAITANALSGDGKTEFAWARDIGHAMIRYVEIEINGKTIDRHYGEWMHIWHCLTTKNITDQGMGRMLGRETYLTEYSSSKTEYVMYVPLYFWLCRSPSLALPVISMQYSDIKVNVEFYDLDKCISVTPTHSIQCTNDLIDCLPYEFMTQVGPDGVERHGMFSSYDTLTRTMYYTPITDEKFIGTGASFAAQIITTSVSAASYLITGVSSGFSVQPDVGASTRTVWRRLLKKIKLKECLLLVDYVYLDDDERTKFAQMKHDYLIEQVYYTSSLPVEGINPKVGLEIDQPCKLTAWLAQYDYVSNSGQRFNFTDSHVIRRSYDTLNTAQKARTYADVEIGQYVGRSLILRETVLLNSQIRAIAQSHNYYQYVQPYQHTDNYLPTGVGMYSYALFPTDTAPSGTTNMSQIESIALNLKMNHRVNLNRRAKFRSYSVCYNILRIDNGLCSLIFV